MRYLTKEGYRSPTEARKIISDVQLALRAIKKGRNPPPGLLEVGPPPEGVNKFAAIISELAPKLRLMDRYERRAVSQRK